ncbi:hypothetical protein D9C73_007964 [Collichthys lucidus]|uniref:Mixed lineage kinase domain-containing protein n=1 Tax=Collichthys lucidus TaxID=240159 RepID=A0A4U5UGY8_COLLU|nr:hypothetical protein D9C73_007964 [Collichthys lucidus]
MLLKVKYQNTKKYIRLLSGFTFLDFIAQAQTPEQDIILEIQIDPGPSPTTQDGISEEVGHGLLEPILSIAKDIYTLVEKVKANRERCQRLSCRVKALENMVKVIKERGKRQTSAHCALWKPRRRVRHLNERLSDAVQVLSVFLQVEQRNVLDQVFDQTTRQKEDAVDGRKDNEELKKLLHDYMKAQEEKYTQFRIDMERAHGVLEKPSITEITTRDQSDELKYDHPKKPFMTTHHPQRSTEENTMDSLWQSSDTLTFKHQLYGLCHI